MIPLSQFQPQQIDECLALLAEKQQAYTRDRKPYYRVTFRDAQRSATAMIWNDSDWFQACEQTWEPGQTYKLKCRYLENKYGSQIEIMHIEPAPSTDSASGNDAMQFLPQTRFDPQEMFAELLTLAQQHISEAPLCQLVLNILEERRELFQKIPAAQKNHHAYIGGLLEHVLSVARTAVYFAEKYAIYYPDINPPLSKPLVVAGAILHDIGKLVELKLLPQGAKYTAEGELVGHILLGRDMVRAKAAEIVDLNPETLLRLEHIIISHQNLPEWGSPISPKTPEALLVHYADDIDAKYQMLAETLMQENPQQEEFTGRDNPLRRRFFRGFSQKESE